MPRNTLGCNRMRHPGEFRPPRRIPEPRTAILLGQCPGARIPEILVNKLSPRMLARHRHALAEAGSRLLRPPPTAPCAWLASRSLLRSSGIGEAGGDAEGTSARHRPFRIRPPSTRAFPSLPKPGSPADTRPGTPQPEDYGSSTPRVVAVLPPGRFNSESGWPGTLPC